MILDLLNSEIPLQDRYDNFLSWLDEQNNHNSDYLASLQGVGTWIIDLYFQLHDLDDEEFKIIADNNIDLDTVYFIVHFKKVIRYKIYLKIKVFLSLRQTLSAIRSYVYNEVIAEYEHKLQQISGDFWYASAGQ
jgi:hypothetical protein